MHRSESLGTVSQIPRTEVSETSAPVVRQMRGIDLGAPPSSPKHAERTSNMVACSVHKVGSADAAIKTTTSVAKRASKRSERRRGWRNWDVV
jgi:hypothetical protein